MRRLWYKLRGVIYRPGRDALWQTFGLSYATFITIPRVLAHEMPDEWQGQMAKLLDEYFAKWQGLDDAEINFQVLSHVRGKRVSMPRWLLNYRHPDRDEIARAEGKVNRGK